MFNTWEPEGCDVQADFTKGWSLWDFMHRIDYIAEDAIIRNVSPAMLLKFMNEVLLTDEEREYFLVAYRKAAYNTGYGVGRQKGYDDYKEWGY